jgi:hypothetical protein
MRRKAWIDCALRVNRPQQHSQPSSDHRGAGFLSDEGAQVIHSPQGILLLERAAMAFHWVLPARSTKHQFSALCICCDPFVQPAGGLAEYLLARSLQQLLSTRLINSQPCPEIHRVRGIGTHRPRPHLIDSAPSYCQSACRRRACCVNRVARRMPFTWQCVRPNLMRRPQSRDWKRFPTQVATTCLSLLQAGFLERDVTGRSHAARYTFLLRIAIRPSIPSTGTSKLVT